MKQLTLIQEISTYLSQFSSEVKDKGKLQLTDINKIAEDVLVPILSIAYDTDLINLNSEKANYPGIDLATDEHVTLGSPSKRIAFQITSTKSIDKIKHTLKEYVKHEFYKPFDTIYIYNLIEKQESYQKTSKNEIVKIVNGKFNFDLSVNVIDRIDLSKKIQALTPISKIEEIHKLLQDQFVYKKKSLLSLEIWESDGKLGYGFSNLLNSIDLTTHETLIKEGLPNDAKEILHILFQTFNSDFAQNYEKEKDRKFENLGFNTYLRSAFQQALDSFEIIKDQISFKLNKESFTKNISDSLSKFNKSLKESDYPLVNQPDNHPAVQFVKKSILQIFNSIGINKDLQDTFIKNFNQNIPIRIIETFGSDDYATHQKDTQDKWIRENEKELLIYMMDLAKLGFADGEELEYQETYGTWQDVRNYGRTDEENEEQYSINNNEQIDEIIKRESKLELAENLIEQYFESYINEGYLNNILFIVSDFGKGKTSFLHKVTSKLAEKYLRTHEGLFPIYLNLNEYDRYANSPMLGVLANFLARKFKIDIREDYFKKKNYFFLVDSLDECGELSENNIDRVIRDIKEIQNLDSINRRENRIVIGSRPIDKGLLDQIKKHRPFEMKVKDNKEPKKEETTENYLSIYGFKKEQFDNYINFALRKFWSNDNLPQESELTSFTKTIFQKILKGENTNLYSELLNNVLRGSELKRPIFAYMIFKLIASNSNFINSGKVGVYISFLNQLSRDAKHKDDSNHKVSIKDEFIYRNILHATAILWQYKRNTGEQTSLAKADICRTIEGKDINREDKKVLNEFSDISSIHFLSHSYLGEKDNTLHFQHQSFAEILLAEYYLKVILKCAIDENPDFEEASIQLSIGLPTDQTIDFFKGLLLLLKECVLGDPNEKTICMKRELLIPLLASISLPNHNRRLNSARLKTKWFEKHEEEIFKRNRLTEGIVKDFPITKEILDKVELLCQKIIGSEKTYLLEKPREHNILFANELISMNSIKGKLHEIDKWIALITGNIIGTDIEKKIFFNAKLNGKDLFELIRIWVSNFLYTAHWSVDLFQGIDMRKDENNLIYTHLNFSGLNFSYSYFKNIDFNFSSLTNCNFSYVTFDNASLLLCKFWGSDFNEIKIENNFYLDLCQMVPGVFFPQKLSNRLRNIANRNEVENTDHFGFELNFGSQYSYISDRLYSHGNSNHEDFFNFLSMEGIFKYLFEIGITAQDILGSFKFEEMKAIKTNKQKSLKEKFQEFVYNLEKEVKKE